MIVALKKSQITTEFIVFSGIALIAAIVFISISLGQAKTLYETKEFLLVKDVALKIQNEVSIASYVEKGYTRNFEIPEKISNQDYNISIINNTLIVYTKTTLYSTRLVNITGYLNKGSNTITKTNSRIHLN